MVPEPLRGNMSDPVPDTYAHGMKSKLTVGTVTLCITKFEFEETRDEHDTTGTCNNGKKALQTGLSQVSFNGEAKLDLTKDPFVNLSTGTDIAVDWFADGSGTSPTAYVHIPAARVTNVKLSAPVNDVMSYTFAGKSNGAYTIA